MDYFNIHSGQVQTEAGLKLQGVVIRPDVLYALSLCPIEYPYPAYDADLYTLEPDGKPHPKADES